MTRKLKSVILSLVMAAGFAVPLAVPTTVVSAQGANPQGAVCSGATSLTISDANQPGCPGAANTTDKFNTILTKIINIFSVIVGVIAVIMIIVGGLRYVTSGGDSTKVGGAKNTILYAIIGLIIVALSQVIVQFVLSKSTGTP